MILQPGTQLAQFKILEKLGEGGMGAVYLAEDTKLHRRVALKTLSADMFDNAEHEERFVREARTAAQISHGNVMAIFDIDSAPEASTGKTIQFIVMEYVKGQSLTNHLKTSKIDIAASIRLAEKIASGLAAAHKLRIVHRDIKSDNIIIDEQGEPKILDFGLAKPLEPVQLEGKGESTNTVSQELTRAGKIMGTVSYMSPEQIRGEPVDTRSDIFSYGILLYRMCTGESPFGGGTQVSTMAKILETAPEPPRVKNQDIPPELERIIDKCLQKDPNDRYQDTRDLVVDLRNLRKSYDSGSTDTVSVMRGQIAQHKKSTGSRFNLSWKMLPVVLLGMVLVFAVIIQLIENKPHASGSGGVKAGEHGIAILNFDNRSNDTSLNWLGTGLPEILITDLAQNQSLRVISRQRLLDAIESGGKTPTDEELRDAAVELGAVNLLTGTYFKLGNQVRIDARLEEIGSGKILFAEKVMGSDPFKLVDSLSQKVRAALNLGSAGPAKGSIAQLTSSSPEAYKHYLAGMEQFGRLQYDSSFTEFEAALKIDSTLALAYMRIGMGYQFSGKQQLGMQYMAKARKFQDRLPVREKSMLDIYANIWLDRQIGDASAKLKQMVANYPDDKEIRAIYGIFLAQLDRDTTAGFAQFDTALQFDPNYAFVLEIYGEVCSQYKQFERAAEITRRLVQSSPGSSQPHADLARYLGRLGKYEEAVTEYEKAAAISPNDINNIDALVSLHLKYQRIDQAVAALEREKKLVGDDPFRAVTYFDALVSVNVWQGQFRNALANIREALREARKTKDNQLVYGELSTLCGAFERLEWKDSVALYAARADTIANPFEKLAYPMILVDQDPANEKIARPLLTARLNDFRERLPASMWPQADALQGIFDGTAKADTVALIAAFRDLMKATIGTSPTGNTLNFGVLLVSAGKYAEGKAQIEPIITGISRSPDATIIYRGTYYLGRANEGLGDKQAAIDCYKQVVKFWGNADLPVKEITEAKAHLAKLTS